MIGEMLTGNERVKISVIDDINSPPIYVRDGYLIMNIAVFRVIPTFVPIANRYVFETELPEEFVYLPGVKFFRYVVKALVKRLNLFEKGSKVKIIYRIEVMKE
jgi:hypothetical protein